jgi:RNA polymerase sigma factor (sigma-70 family)
VSAPTRWTLVGAARDGDATARDDLARRYRSAVVAYLRARGAGEDAEDVAQDVFLRLFHKGALERADPAKGSFRVLLRTISRNALASHVARQVARKRGGDAQRAALDVEELSAGADDAVFDSEWLAHLLARCLERLRREHPSYHQAVSGFLVEGLTQGEVAQRLERSPQDVRNHVHRGRKKLAEFLRAEAWSSSRDPDEYATELRFLGTLLG